MVRKGITMAPDLENVDLKEVESALCQIDEVKAVRVVVGKGKSIEEVHVLADTSRGGKQLARDIESMLMAQYGLPVDYKKISIVQIGGKKAVGEKARLKIVSINTEVSAIYATVSVSLQFNGGEYEGIAKGPASQTGRLRLVSLATLDAVEKFTRGICGFDLEDVGILNLGRERVAVSCITLVTQLGEEIFAGSAVVKQNENDAIVKATLDAINRRFGDLIAG